MVVHCSFYEERYQKMRWGCVKGKIDKEGVILGGGRNVVEIQLIGVGS
jgi:hypothetical protein